MKTRVLFLIAAVLLVYPINADALYFDGYGSYLAMGRNDDDSSGRISLGFDFDFYGNSFDSLYVNNNGNVTFESSLYNYTPWAFPSNVKMIAPFFADVDTRPSNGGYVYYDHRYYRDEHEFIVTWKDVGYFSNNTTPKNTFQAVIQEDGDIGFSYENMGWTIGEASDQHAVAGFDAGDNVNYRMIEGSKTSSIASNLAYKQYWFERVEVEDGDDETIGSSNIPVRELDSVDMRENARDAAFWGGVEVYDKSDNSLKPLVSFDQNSETVDKNKNTIVLIHGWNGVGADAGENDHQWMPDMAQALNNREGGDVNVVVWRWEDAAETAWGAPNEYVPGQAINLSRELASLLGEDYDGDIQIMGHSLGAGIATRTAVYLQDEYNVKKLTLFDGPTAVGNDVDLDLLLNGVDSSIYVENYVSSVGAAYYEGNVQNYALLHKFIEDGISAIDAHGYPMEWYIHTIENADYQYGYNLETAANSRGTIYQDWTDEFSMTTDRESWYEDEDRPASARIVLDGDDVNNHDIVVGERRFGQDQIILAQADMEFYTNGHAWERDGYLYGQTASPVYIMSDIEIPYLATYLEFDVLFSELSEGDIFSVFWNDNLLLSFLTDGMLDELFHIDLIDISPFAGQQGTLAFGLDTLVDGGHSLFGITNINLYSEEAVPTPEPSTFVLLLLGGMCVYACRNKFIHK